MSEEDNNHSGYVRDSGITRPVGLMKRIEGLVERSNRQLGVSLPAPDK